jgi:signal transduction histidine kinase
MGAGSGRHLILAHSLLLGERLYLFARLRFLAAVGILVGGLFATYVVGVVGLDLPALAGAAGFLAAYNIALFVSVRPRQEALDEQLAERRLVSIAHVSILLDYLVLTFAIWIVGGAQSPFLAFYLLHAILASVLLSRRAAFAHAIVGYLLLAGLVCSEWTGLIARHRPLGAVPGGGELELRSALTILFVYALLMGVTTVLTTGIVRLLRENEQGLLDAGEHLERLADMRRSFLHVVLHDVRSPVGTVVSMLDGLAGGIDGTLAEAQRRRIERARERLRGVLDLLRGLRVLADLETERLDSLMASTDLAATILATVDEHQEAADARAQSLVVDIPPALPRVRAVDRLIHEALANYISNAIKYTPQGGRIEVRVRLLGERVRVEVVDNGPGIAREDQGRLFQEFVRLRGSSAQAPQPSGIGLGLSIVRRIAEAHRGTVGVRSEPGKGSAFFIEWPIALPSD